MRAPACTRGCTVGTLGVLPPTQYSQALLCMESEDWSTAAFPHCNALCRSTLWSVGAVTVCLAAKDANTAYVLLPLLQLAGAVRRPLPAAAVGPLLPPPSAGCCRRLGCRMLLPWLQLLRLGAAPPPPGGGPSPSSRSLLCFPQPSLLTINADRRVQRADGVHRGGLAPHGGQPAAGRGGRRHVRARRRRAGCMQRSAG